MKMEVSKEALKRIKTGYMIVLTRLNKVIRRGLLQSLLFIRMEVLWKAINIISDEEGIRADIDIAKINQMYFRSLYSKLIKSELIKIKMTR